MVMYNFEREFYADPDQDLNALWWDLVAKYQLIEKPKKRNAPDWAAKIHIPLYPCYYHNYLLGELLASQFHYHLAYDILKLDSDAGLGYVNEPKIGTYFQKNVFKPGNRYHWNTMIQKATGKPLTSEYFVKQFLHDYE
jgi:peptidyl-dipeptidase A